MLPVLRLEPFNSLLYVATREGSHYLILRLRPRGSLSNNEPKKIGSDFTRGVPQGKRYLKVLSLTLFLISKLYTHAVLLKLYR